ncbi:DUF1491 family protein [Neptunicoccus cionae]|uniref:DUF1491 family protein n=1 Tax=Neptunicoccus cionae TaxID=2035344 RepID=UPI000C770766|nr:DUF1491 family protein [Amylibacter cionae]PLS19894.1 DUF1491 domain-containing protein [Amylibacter cionae]
MVRVTAEFWVKAYLRRLALADIAAFVTARGDATAGAVLVKQAPLDGTATLYQRSYNLDGDRVWVTLAQGPERDVDEAVRRQRSFDPDIWVVEVEDRAGRHLLDEDGLRE